MRDRQINDIFDRREDDFRSKDVYLQTQIENDLKFFSNCGHLFNGNLDNNVVKLR